MLLTVSLLCIVTFIAGLIDSIAGGGGLLRLPALLIAGVSPQQALGTNKFTGAIGTGAAMLNFARKGLILWKLAFIGIPCALLGSAAGSKCILAFDPQTAGKILIALLPVAAMITLIPRRSKSCKDSFTSKDVYLLTPLICFSVGFYDGFFGPGAGSFFIIAFNVCLRMNLIQASALTKVFNLSSNLGSLFVFLYHGDVLFLYAIPMTVADVLGNLAGSQLAIRTGPTIVRRFLLLSLVILFVSLIWKYYFEDDIYGELATEYPRPRTIHSWDIDGRVMLCSSFTKTIAPGLRIGWIAPGRYYDKLLQMKYAASGTNVPSTQLAACNFIREGHYHRHVRRMRQIYQRNIEIYTCWLREFFPCGICVTRPKGGFMLWVELPEQVDMVCVAKQLCRLKIQVAPGSLFSAAGKYRNCVRINCALPPTEKHKAVMVKLGEAVKVAME